MVFLKLNVSNTKIHGRDYGPLRETVRKSWGWVTKLGSGLVAKVDKLILTIASDRMLINY